MPAARNSAQVGAILRNSAQFSDAASVLSGAHYRGYDLYKLFRTSGELSQPNLRAFLRAYLDEVRGACDLSDDGGASRKVLQLARWSAQIVKLFEAMHLPPGPDAGCFWPASGPQKRPPIVEDKPRIHAWYAVLRRMSTCCSGAAVRVHVCI